MVFGPLGAAVGGLVDGGLVDGGLVEGGLVDGGLVDGGLVDGGPVSEGLVDVLVEFDACLALEHPPTNPMTAITTMTRPVLVTFPRFTEIGITTFGSFNAAGRQ